MPENLVARCDSRNPFAIAAFLNITVLFEELGSIKGYFNKAYGYKFIHVNKNLSEREQTIVAAHELGHAVLHLDLSSTINGVLTSESTRHFEVDA